ncbi:hypothetical protein ACP70R_029309 [Stipagrostis hirtigluma subsp. patula]
MDGHGGAARLGVDKHRRSSTSSLPTVLSRAAEQLEAAVRMWPWPAARGCKTRRALPAVCVAAALAVAVVVLYAGGGAPDEMPASLFIDDLRGIDIVLGGT